MRSSATMPRGIPQRFMMHLLYELGGDRAYTTRRRAFCQRASRKQRGRNGTVASTDPHMGLVAKGLLDNSRARHTIAPPGFAGNAGGNAWEKSWARPSRLTLPA